MQPETFSIDTSRATLYRNSPSWNDLNTAAIGGIKFKTVEDGVELLKRMIAVCRQEGYRAVLGPLDGDTWHSYRLVYESNGMSPFLMEPTSGEHDLTVFERAGFEPVSKYISAKADLANTLGENPATIPGITIEPWDGKNGAALIRDLFDMSTDAFAGNKFFTPIAFDDFLAIYEPLLPLIQKEHVLFARGEQNELKGFLFGSPDFMDQSELQSAILKTYASKMRGVGHLLADTYHRRAIDMGFKSVIHALIHEDNTSRNRSEMHNSEVFRRYALMGRKL